MWMRQGAVQLATVGCMAGRSSADAPEFVMRAELLQLLRVSPTRLVQLQKEPDWPEPIAELIAGKLYRYADIKAWADKKGRTLYPIDATRQPGRSHPRTHDAHREP
jgi:hypothetical protein